MKHKRDVQLDRIEKNTHLIIARMDTDQQRDIRLSGTERRAELFEQMYHGEVDRRVNENMERLKSENPELYKFLNTPVDEIGVTK